jgi:hypothetical protein
MPRKRTPGWMACAVFGLLFLRALVPAGFMVASVDGRPAIVVCDGSMPAGMHEHHHHASGAEHAAPHDGAHGDPTCPYAQCSGSAPMPALPIPVGASVDVQRVKPLAITQIFPASGPIRKHRSRGPPDLA